AAREARDAARSAATHARNAGNAANEAAEHAGDAATAAAKSTEHANAATAAANAATAAVSKAQQIFTLAREVETEELLGRTNAGLERARDDKAEADAQATAQAEQNQVAQAQQIERDRLVAKAAEQGADPAVVASEGRTLAVQVMKNGTAWGRAAAEAALSGPDDVVIDYLRNGWPNAQQQDDRSYVERLAEESDNQAVRDAAETALDGDASAVTAFIQSGQYQAAAEGMRVTIAQVLSDAGPILTETGRTALASGDPKKYSEFLVTTQYTARTQDERVRAAQLIDSGGPEVRAAARIALEGSAQALHAFIASGQYTAQRKDHLAATHVAQVQKLIADAAKIAATATQNAATAQKVAATARKAAAEASEWATRASEAATKAQGYAQQADQYAKAAETSAAQAAASARTARDAANRANVSAADAARSATDATLSSETAQAAASTAAYHATEARKSADAAGQDAAEALKAATEAFTVAVTKQREEEEARRKAAVTAKEKEKNDNGRRAAELYRCGQSLVPCDPQKLARWCQHEETLCDIVAHSKEFADAMDQLLNAELSILGLTDLEVCLRKKDIDNCKGLMTDALIAGKYKWLEKILDELKLLKRGCKILGKTPGLTLSQVESTTAIAASAGSPCGEHKVPGLPKSVNEIPGSSGCEICAEQIRKSLGGGTIFTIKPTMSPFLPPYRGKEAGWYMHVVVVYNGKVYDAWTGRGGESIAEYKSRWEWTDVIDFGF
ncbi:ALF repeat-containing protein, partial [Kribbella solani]|uniref:ALF repeat-containing protein n=1 Tax=Kribbella solani TaxID=236067 RepID=UPI0029B8CB7A